jgi:hypothetical protein
MPEAGTAGPLRQTQGRISTPLGQELRATVPSVHLTGPKMSRRSLLPHLS